MRRTIVAAASSRLELPDAFCSADSESALRVRRRKGEGNRTSVVPEMGTHDGAGGGGG